MGSYMTPNVNKLFSYPIQNAVYEIEYFTVSYENISYKKQSHSTSLRFEPSSKNESLLKVAGVTYDPKHKRTVKTC